MITCVKEHISNKFYYLFVLYFLFKKMSYNHLTIVSCWKWSFISNCWFIFKLRLRFITFMINSFSCQMMHETKESYKVDFFDERATCNLKLFWIVDFNCQAGENSLLWLSFFALFEFFKYKLMECTSVKCR